VLRTHGWTTLRYAKDGNSYHYGIQTGPSFATFTAGPAVTSSKSSMLWALEYKEKGCSKQTSTAPLEAKAAWETAKKTAAPKKTAKTAKTAPPPTP
jgi:hypothetical protein